MESRKNRSVKRFIFNDDDLESFLNSQAKSELMKLIVACGNSCSTIDSKIYQYNPQKPLKGLSPAMAALNGSLFAMESWVQNFPPKQDVEVRFGNPAFRDWHKRLTERSQVIVRCILLAHQKYPGPDDYDETVLKEMAEMGRLAALGSQEYSHSSEVVEKQDFVPELASYLEASFGHPVRLDYGTGHESSFQVFLYALCKLGCFGSTEDRPPSSTRLKAITLSIWRAYLSVTRKIQNDYMLEPAGSHGVWGLDDYHCLPFYYGACQLQADGEDSTPQSIHDETTLANKSNTYLYYGCISYIKSLKKGAPFFESSPMLNDISHLPTWKKVASGLIKLYEGEVLKKRQVVQHFVFGEIFKAEWTPSQGEREAPAETFRSDKINVAPMARAPWVERGGSSRPSPMPPTKAPWGK